MVTDRLRAPIRAILVIYVILAVFRLVEYLLIRTDQSVLGEALLHKLVGIALLGVAVWYFSFTLAEIGFVRPFAVRFVLLGVLLGASCFLVAYGGEFFLLSSQGQGLALEVYVSSYGVDGNRGRQTALLFFVICIVGNLVNVIMEEGIFRGLFLKLAEFRYSFLAAATLSSALFGLWHSVGPMRALLDGDMSPAGAGMSALLLCVTSAVTGFKFCLLVKITGSLWMGIGDHFVNNTVINLVHVVSSTGADDLLTLRISIAQTLSFLIVLALYWRTGAQRKATFRAASPASV